MSVLYNLDTIHAIAEGDQEFVASVVSAFLEEMPVALNALEKAIQERDYSQIYQWAHTLKPNVAMLGMEQTQRRALKLETLGKQSADIADIDAQFFPLKKEILQVLAELQKDFTI